MDQAVRSYQTILDKIKTTKKDETNKADLSDLVQMATWRLEQISWQHTTQQKLTQLVPALRPTPPPVPPPSHDASGHPTPTPAAVR